MPPVIHVEDRDLIERYVRRDVARHLYELGDLDPFFWPHTRWYGTPGVGGQLEALALLYQAPSLPTLLALADDEPTGALLSAIGPELPPRLYAHLGPSLLPRLGDRFIATPHGRHLKMVQRDRERLDVTTDDVQRLEPADHDELLELYRRSYPGNWFDARMLETGHYYGIRCRDTLVCVAGVHVFSPRYRVAALGNVTTDPKWRGHGLARRATAHLCRALQDSVDVIGLNVKADNAAAIACYRGLGFVDAAEYDEVLLEDAGPASSSQGGSTADLRSS